MASRIRMGAIRSYPPPCPLPQQTVFTGDFTATGSFSGYPGVDIPLDGVGTTTMTWTSLLDPTIPAIEWVPASMSYNFIAVPEPSVIFTTGLGLVLLALTRWS